MDNRGSKNNRNQLRKGQRNANKEKAVATEQESMQTKTNDTTYIIYRDEYDCKRVVVWLNFDCVQFNLSLTVELMS
jgi:hypothetical protein